MITIKDTVQYNKKLEGFEPQTKHIFEFFAGFKIANDPEDILNIEAYDAKFYLSLNENTTYSNDDICISASKNGFDIEGTHGDIIVLCDGEHNTLKNFMNAIRLCSGFDVKTPDLKGIEGVLIYPYESVLKEW